VRSRFGVTKVCIVADWGMVSEETVEALERQERSWQYILGTRMRSQNEVKEEAWRGRVAIGSCIPHVRSARIQRR